MKYKGKFIGNIVKVLRNGRKSMIQIESDDADLMEAPSDMEFVFDYKKYFEKKTLSQNGYYWVLVRKIAEHRDVNRSESYVHNELLRGFGQPVLFEGERVPVVINVNKSRSVDESSETHLKPTSDLRVGKDDEIYRTYILLRGSRTYDTKEMNRLIDGAIQWARDLDIETDTPEEIVRMKLAWGE